jgi:hypothetical protein
MQEHDVRLLVHADVAGRLDLADRVSAMALVLVIGKIAVRGSADEVDVVAIFLERFV